VRGGVADAADALERGDGADQGGQVGHVPAVAIAVDRAAVGVDVLAQQVDLAHALRRELGAFEQHVVEGPRHFLAAGVGHHAERAVLAAALDDRDIGARALGARFGQAVELLDLGEADVHLRAAAVAAGVDHAGQAVQGLRTEHQVHVGRALEDGLALLAGDAAADADQHRPVLLQVFPLAELGEDLFLGLFADRAGVDQDDVGLGLVGGQLQAMFGGEHVGHAGRVVLIHLATVGLDVELALGGRVHGHGGGYSVPWGAPF
jgi:hypothetical protein